MNNVKIKGILGPYNIQIIGGKLERRSSSNIVMENVKKGYDRKYSLLKEVSTSM